MRFVQPVALLLGTAMYIAILAWIFGLDDSSNDNGSSPDPSWILVVVGVWNLVMLVATIIAIIDSVLRIRESRTSQLATDALIVKLVAIPFFVLNFAVLMMLFNVSIVLIFMGPLLWMFIAIGIALTYLTMLSTSVYSWAAIAQQRRARLLDNGMTAIYTIMSFIFVLDTAAGVVLFGNSRRRPRLAWLWILLGTGLAMVLLGVADYFSGVLELDFPEFGYIAANYGVDWLEWGIPMIAGGVIILPTVIVSLARRSTLRLEARRAAEAIPITV